MELKNQLQYTRRKTACDECGKILAVRSFWNIDYTGVDFTYFKLPGKY